jgi:hypothetical protein
MLCRTVLRDHQCLYMAAGKAGENLDKLVGHLGIDVGDGLQSWNEESGLRQQAEEAVAADEREGLVEGVEMGSPQLNWGLSDLDLEAIAQGFRLDGELHYLMHPVGLS